jgi:hypothetical protein
MAQRVLTSFIDDLDGSEADGTIQFGLDGKPLEIDLSAANAARLRDVLAPYIAAGTKVGRAGTRVTRHSRGAEGWAERRAHNVVVRRWANEHGYDVGDRGRIPAQVVEAYEARDQAPPTERGGSPSARRRSRSRRPVAARLTRWRSRLRSGSGPPRTATRSASGAGCPLGSWRPTGRRPAGRSPVGSRRGVGRRPQRRSAADSSTPNRPRGPRGRFGVPTGSQGFAGRAPASAGLSPATCYFIP